MKFYIYAKKIQVKTIKRKKNGYEYFKCSKLEERTHEFSKWDSLIRVKTSIKAAWQG